MQSKFQDRIEYEGDLEPICKQICNEFQFGEFKTFKVIEKGYEDFNLTLRT